MEATFVVAKRSSFKECKISLLDCRHSKYRASSALEQLDLPIHKGEHDEKGEGFYQSAQDDRER